MHLLVDSTGLKLCGSGEWLLEKYGMKTRRSWRKLHIAMDADTGQIAAAALTPSDVDDASQVGAFARRRWMAQIASFTADGAYDSGRCLWPDRRASIPTRPSLSHHAPAPCQAKQREAAPTTRDRHLTDHHRARPHGLAEGLWLQLACSG